MSGNLSGEMKKWKEVKSRIIYGKLKVKKDKYTIEGACGTRMGKTGEERGTLV